MQRSASRTLSGVEVAISMWPGRASCAPNEEHICSLLLSGASAACWGVIPNSTKPRRPQMFALGLEHARQAKGHVGARDQGRPTT
jgi:hypothetical protein